MNRTSIATVMVGLVLAFSAGVIFSNLDNQENLDKMSGKGSASANIVAAAQESNQGAIGEVKVDIIPGDGDTLIETNPFVQADTQLSATKAREIAEEYTGKTLENHDIIYEIKMDSKVVGGPSAGAAMTIATIAAITNKKVKKDAAITGTITESGRIGKVGEIPVKATAAGQNNIKTFYVPQGQSAKINYQPVLEKERRGLFVYKDVEYQRQILNISKYTQQKYGMKTQEIRNIYQAADKILTQ